jgi:hypothetical protein
MYCKNITYYKYKKIALKIYIYYHILFVNMLGALRIILEIRSIKRRCTPIGNNARDQASGSFSLNVEPSPVWLSASTFPRWSRAMWRTMESPRPVPPASRLRLLSAR